MCTLSVCLFKRCGRRWFKRVFDFLCADRKWMRGRPRPMRPSPDHSQRTPLHLLQRGGLLQTAGTGPPGTLRSPRRGPPRTLRSHCGPPGTLRSHCGPPGTLRSHCGPPRTLRSPRESDSLSLALTSVCVCLSIYLSVCVSVCVCVCLCVCVCNLYSGSVR